MHFRKQLGRKNETTLREKSHSMLSLALRITYQADEWNVNDNRLMYEILLGWETLERMTEK